MDREHTRERVYYDGQLHTVLKTKGSGRRRKLQLRSPHGMVLEDWVPESECDVPDEEEPEGSYQFGEPAKR